MPMQRKCQIHWLTDWLFIGKRGSRKLKISMKVPFIYTRDTIRRTQSVGTKWDVRQGHRDFRISIETSPTDKNISEYRMGRPPWSGHFRISNKTFATGITIIFKFRLYCNLLHLSIFSFYGTSGIKNFQAKNWVFFFF